MRKTLIECTEKPYAFVKKQMSEKRAKPSFLSQSIETIGDDEYMEFVHKWTALSMFTGGADTVSPTPSRQSTLFLPCPNARRSAFSQAH